MLAGLYDRPLGPAGPEEARNVAELRARFAALDCATSVDAPPSEKDWMANLREIRDAVLHRDPREFLRWHVISSTMFAKYPDYAIPELACLKAQESWRSRWMPAIEESPVGHPLPYYRYPKSSANLIHHAYHLAQFETRTQIHVAQADLVFEFGGGYGSMCRLVHKLGFRGRYVIFDLPGLSELQQFYLQSLGLRTHSLSSWSSAQNGILCTSDKSELTAALGEAGPHSRNRLFIATWSLSESPVALRDELAPLFHSFDLFLIAYQHRFCEVDNRAFFTQWKREQEGVVWQEWEIDHMAASSYLIGRRQSRQGCM